MEQAKKLYRVKNDDIELVEICQYIRDNFPRFEVLMEHYIFWNDDDTFRRIGECVREGNLFGYRHPDIIVRLDKKLLFVMEIDGSIHDYKVLATDTRNAEYEFAGIPLEVISKEELDDDILSEIYKRCAKYAE